MTPKNAPHTTSFYPFIESYDIDAHDDGKKTNTDTNHNEDVNPKFLFTQK